MMMYNIVEDFTAMSVILFEISCSQTDIQTDKDRSHTINEYVILSVENWKIATITKCYVSRNIYNN